VTGKYLWKGVGAGVPCWHIHHSKLLEWSERLLDERAEFIRAHKPESEIETRLRLMRPVNGTLPDAVCHARAAYNELFAVYCKMKSNYHEMRVACDEAWSAYENTMAVHRPEIEALHAKECPDCPWDGKTILPAEEVEEKP